jgi:hypothetical protein
METLFYRSRLQVSQERLVELSAAITQIAQLRSAAGQDLAEPLSKEIIQEMTLLTFTISCEIGKQSDMARTSL